MRGLRLATLRRYPAIRKIPGLLRRFGHDQSGNYLIIGALLMPVLVGVSGLGTEVGLWLYKQQMMQGVADSSAVGAATANSTSASELSVSWVQRELNL